MNDEHSRRQNTDGRWRVGEWTVDLHSGHMRRQSARHDEFQLNRRLVRVLDVLIAGVGTVVSATQILESAWQGRVVSNDSVSTAIYQLRKAFGDESGASRYIETIPGEGYRLVAAVTSLDMNTSKSRPIVWAAPGLVILAVATVLFVQYTAEVTARTVFVPAVANSTGLVANDGVSIMLRSRVMNAIGQNAPQLIATVSEDVDSGFTLESELIGCEAGPAVVFRLVETDTQRHVWSEHFDMSDGAYEVPVQEIAVKRISDTLAKVAVGAIQFEEAAELKSAKKNSDSASTT